MFGRGRARAIGTVAAIGIKNTLFGVGARDPLTYSAVAVLIELAKETGARIHTLHTHAKGSIEQIRRAKPEGVPMTAAVDLKY